MVNGAVPEFFVEDHGQGVQLTQFKHHAADGDGVHLHFVPLFLQRRQLGFGFFEAVAQFGVSGTVGFFGHSVGSIFCNAQAQHPGDGGEFLFQSLNIRINLSTLETHLLPSFLFNAATERISVFCNLLIKCQPFDSWIQRDENIANVVSGI